MVDIPGGDAQEISLVGSHVKEEVVSRNATTSPETEPMHFESIHTETPSIDHIMPASDGIFHCPKVGCKSKLLFDNRSQFR